jgi:glutamine---fructose-6-phosphate transaminase (isomerizing)
MTTFDPRQPLAPAPDPWEEMPDPSIRSGPPWHMTEMIAAEPFLAERLLNRLADADSGVGRLAGAIGQAASSGAPIIVTGCGTSEHAAQGAAEIFRASIRAAGLPSGPTAVTAAQAFELALDPPTGGLVIGVSHEGGSRATIDAMDAAGDAGAQIGLITGSAHAPAGDAADEDLIVETVEMDQGWCHTIGYVAPLVAAAAVGADLAGADVGAEEIQTLLADGARDETGAEAIAAVLAGCRTILTIASGADRPAARELALKIEEAAWIPTTMRDLETFLHGHLAGVDARTGLVLVLADTSPDADARARRAADVLRAAAEIGMPSAAILATRHARVIAPALTPVGRLVLPPAPGLPPAIGALVGSAVPLQLLTERLARVRGVDPDPIRRDEPVYLRAAQTAE